MRYHTDPSTGPRTCQYDSPLPDSPALEQSAADAARAHDTQAMHDRIADQAWAMQCQLNDSQHLQPVVIPTPAPSTVPVLECECGRIIPGNLSSDIYVKSPKTGLICQIDHRFAGDLPPRVRGRICIADDEGTRRAKFTLLELKGILRVYRLCCQPVKFEAGPMVSTGHHTFARRH
jgi:hypothetical protein